MRFRTRRSPDSVVTLCAPAVLGAVYPVWFHDDVWHRWGCPPPVLCSACGAFAARHELEFPPLGARLRALSGMPIVAPFAFLNNLMEIRVTEPSIMSKRSFVFVHFVCACFCFYASKSLIRIHTGSCSYHQTAHTRCILAHRLTRSRQPTYTDGNMPARQKTSVRSRMQSIRRSVAIDPHLRIVVG